VQLSDLITNLPPYHFADAKKKIAERKAAGVDVISLSMGDPDLPAPQAVIDRLCSTLQDPENTRYPEYRGIRALHEAIAVWFERRFGVRLVPERDILPLLGSKEGLVYAAAAVLNPGDVALIPDPYYTVYVTGSTTVRAEPYLLPLLEQNGYLPDLDSIPRDVLARIAGRVEKLVNFAPEVSGTNSIAVNLPWLSWTQGNSTQNLFDWTMYAKNLQTGEILSLARSRQSSGSFLPGQQPTQVFRGTTLAWSQALPGPLTSYSTELHIFDPDARSEKILASGRVSAPVYAGNLLIWGERDGTGVYSFKTVDATTLAPVPVPAVLRDPSSIIYVTGSRDWFAWSVEGLQEVNVWRVGSAERRTYRTPDIKHYFQFMQFAGSYLLWYSGVASAILDLDSGAIVDVGGPLAAGDDLIVMSQPIGPHVKGEFVASRVSATRASALPPLAGCTR